MNNYNYFCLFVLIYVVYYYIYKRNRKCHETKIAFIKFKIINVIKNNKKKKNFKFDINESH